MLNQFLMPDNNMAARWLTYSMIAMVLGAVTGSAFFLYGGIFAALSDSAAVFIGLTLIPVVLRLKQIFYPYEPGLSRVSVITGIAGLCLFTIGAFFLVLYHTLFDSLPETAAFMVQFSGIFLKSIWLLLTGILVFKTRKFDRITGRAATFAGICYLIAFIYLPLNPESPLVFAAILTAVIAYFVWAINTRNTFKKFGSIAASVD